MQKFKDLGLSEEILDALAGMGFEKPSEIQEKAIPQLLGEKTDFLGLAQTGTGKTAAFGLPLLDKIDFNSTDTQAIIIAPTRELAIQIKTEMDKFAKFKKGISIDAVYGGASIDGQIKSIRRRQPHIIVGTAGRMIDLLKRKIIKLQAIDFVILDEADEMLNMGFKEDIDEILTYTPETKSVWLFSATMPKEIRSIVKNYMKDPFEVKIDPKNVVNTNISHQFASVTRSNKLKALKRYVESLPNIYGVIFCRTKSDTGFIADNLSSFGYDIEALNGDLSQSQRESVMKRFRSQGLKLIAATDVAARGIDVSDLTHVIHYSLPDDFSFYAHRAGRTARAGKKGISITIASPEDNRRIKGIQRELNIDFEKVLIPSAKEVQSIRLTTFFNGLKELDTSKVSEDLVAEYEELLGTADKGDLVRMILAQQLGSYSANDSNDLNTSESDRGGNRERGARNNVDSKNARFFVNLGQFDNMDKKQLVEFLSSTSGVSKSSFGDITLQRNHSFFDVSKEDSAKISNGFKGVEVGGREIRVNRDEQGGGGGRRNGGGRSGSGGGRSYGGGNRRSGSGGGGNRRPRSGGGDRDRKRY